MKILFRVFARNKVFSNIVLVLIFFSGSIAVFSMKRENLPQFSLNKILITVRYEGADPKEVEEGVTRKIESAIQGLNGIKSCTTYSSKNRALAYIDVEDGFDTAEVMARVKASVGAIVNLPLNADKPMVKELKTSDPIVLLAVKGSMDERRRKQWAERIREDLLTLPTVSQVMIYGVGTYEIAIEVSEQKLRQFGLSFSEVTRAVRRSNLNLSGGVLHTKGEEIRLRTLGRKRTGPKLADIIIKARPDGSSITLDRVAEVKDDFTEDPVRAFLDGQPTVLMLISKGRGEDALAIADGLSRLMWLLKTRCCPKACN